MAEVVDKAERDAFFKKLRAKLENKVQWRKRFLFFKYIMVYYEEFAKSRRFEATLSCEHFEGFSKAISVQ
jgi:hypothetical protein